MDDFSDDLQEAMRNFLEAYYQEWKPYVEMQEDLDSLVDKTLLETALYDRLLPCLFIPILEDMTSETQEGPIQPRQMKVRKYVSTGRRVGPNNLWEYKYVGDVIK